MKPIRRIRVYYYACSINGRNKEAIVSNAIIPVFQQLLEVRFPYPYSRFIGRHIRGRISQDKYIPGDFKDSYSHEYEVLFRKWDIGVLSDWDFVKDVDGLLTHFLLTRINHVPGQKSPTFNVLIDRAQKMGIGIADETKAKCMRIHDERTRGLHRLHTSLTKEQISELSFGLYNYFQFYDEFQESQQIKTERMHGKRYRRIKYGQEAWVDESGKPYKDENGTPYDSLELSKDPCHDCGAIRGQYHCQGCDVEQCPRCGGQRLGCSCKLLKDFDG